MFGLFKRSPLKKLEAEHKAFLTKGFHAERNGYVCAYSFLTAEAEAVLEKIDAFKAKEGSEGRRGSPPLLRLPLPILGKDLEAFARTDVR